MINIKKFLKENSEFEYAQFSRKFIFSQHPILGVRTPLLRKFAKQIEPEQIELNSTSSHEEILLYGFSAVANYKTESEQLEYFQNLLPHIDNWATCYCIVGEMKQLCGEDSYEFFTNLLSDNREFHVRVGLIGLMRNFLKSDKVPEILNNIRKITAQQYYVKMATAWLYAELAAIDFELAKNEIHNTEDKFTRTKAISKARESRRLSADQKEELRGL